MTNKNIQVSGSKTVYDAIVVGSGITGGWAAKALTERGLKVLLLERGRHVEHIRDYILESFRSWHFPGGKQARRAHLAEAHPVQRQCDAFSEKTRHFFVNDLEHPYETAPDKPFSWIRGYHLGGRSLTWARQSYRMGDVDFEGNLRDGTGIDWPIRYRDLEPWYSHVERFIGVSGQAEGFGAAPDSIFQPPMAMNAVEQAARDRVAQAYPGRRMTIGRVAVLTERLGKRYACIYRDRCAQGCLGGSYFSSLSSTLPAARATGNLTIRVNAIAHSIVYDQEKDRATGVRIIDAETNETEVCYGRLVFLCASTLGTTQILLNSTSPRFPTGLGNSSGTLGRYLMDHHFQVGATGEMPGFEDQRHQAGRPNGIFMPRFRNLDDASRHPDFTGGYWFQGHAWRPGVRRGPAVVNRLKQAVRPARLRPWRMWFGGWGECLPYADNHVTLDPERVDDWGIPLLKVQCTFRGNEQRMRQDMLQTAAETLEAAGLRDIHPYDTGAPPGLCIHEMGTARMGRDPETSVLNAHNQMHDVPNVFVTDGACMTSSGSVSPSLTYMALTARACDYAVRAGNQSNL